MGTHNACVKCIIDSYIGTLIDNPHRKFMHVESGFFYMWWILQNDEMKAKVKKLVKTG